MTTIHDRIRARRRKLNLSQEQLADLIKRSWQTVQQWENGKTAPSRNNLPKVAAALGTTPEYLLHGIVPGASVREPDPAPYVHPDPTIRDIVAVLETLNDTERGQVLERVIVIAELKSGRTGRQTAA